MRNGGQGVEQDDGFYKVEQREEYVKLMYWTNSANLNLVEFATVGMTKDGQIYHHLWGADEITALLKEHDLAKSDAGPDGGA